MDFLKILGIGIVIIIVLAFIFLMAGTACVGATCWGLLFGN